MTTTTPFAGLIGQDQAVAVMRRAAEQPSHAYLLVGPKGSDLVAAARAFASALVAPEADERAVDLVRRGSHPDVQEFEPEGTNLSIRQVREHIVPEAWRSPIEAEALCRGGMESANALLKTFEEPPETTVMLLVTSSPDELIATVQSRCQRIDLVPLDEATVTAALQSEGHSEPAAALAARLGGSELGRARALATDLRPLREAFLDALARLDGTGASAALVAEIFDEAVKDAIAVAKQAHTDELAEFDRTAEEAGYPPRAVATLRRRMTTRHDRHERIARRDALLEGITAIETVYRDALAGEGAPRRNVDRPPVVVEARAGARALDVCREARQALVEFNPNEGLMLERLALHLPGVAPSARRRLTDSSPG